MPGSGVGTNYFLKLDGIAGESADAKHKDEIELVSFSWGAHVSGGGAAGGGGGAGKAQMTPFQFMMRVNKASPAVFLATVSGRHLKDATLSVRRTGKVALDWLKVKFSDVLISSYEQAGDDEEAPHELVAFDFKRVELTYVPQSASGSPGAPIKTGWDLSKNAKI